MNIYILCLSEITIDLRMENWLFYTVRANMFDVMVELTSPILDLLAQMSELSLCSLIHHIYFGVTFVQM